MAVFVCLKKLQYWSLDIAVLVCILHYWFVYIALFILQYWSANITVLFGIYWSVYIIVLFCIYCSVGLHIAQLVCLYCTSYIAVLVCLYCSVCQVILWYIIICLHYSIKRTAVRLAAIRSRPSSFEDVGLLVQLVLPWQQCQKWIVSRDTSWSCEACWRRFILVVSEGFWFTPGEWRQYFLPSETLHHYDNNNNDNINN